MITLSHVPPSLVFGKNPIWYNLTTDQYIVTGTLPYWDLTMDATGPQSGDHFILTIADTPIRIDFIDPQTIPASVFEIPGNDDGLDMDLYGISLLTALQKVHALTAHFTITLEVFTPAQVVIRFTSASGAAFTGSVTANNSSGAYVAGTPDTYTEHYKILVQLWMESTFNSGDYHLIDTLEQTPDDNQAVVFNLMKQVKAQLRHELPEFLLSSAKVLPTTQPLGRFYLQYTDKSGNPVVQQDWSIEPTIHTAYLAGVGHDLFQSADLNLDWIAAARAFTHQPETVLVTPNQPIYLYFVPNNTPNAIELEVMVYFEDGSSQSYAPTLTGTMPARHQLTAVTVGYTQLAIDQVDNTKRVHRYTVRVKSAAGTYYTALRTYVVNHHYQAQERYLLLPNGMGGYDTLLATGTRHQQLNRPMEMVDVPAVFGADSSQPTVVALPDDHHTTFELSAGPFDTAWQQYLEDLLLSHGQAYLVGESHFIPIVITSSTIDLVDENEDVHQLRLQYRYGFDQHNYRP